ncbi:hypothetical protein WJX82_001814 [Trebouxia sp. C0006]
MQHHQAGNLREGAVEFQGPQVLGCYPRLTSLIVPGHQLILGAPESQNAQHLHPRRQTPGSSFIPNGLLFDNDLEHKVEELFSAMPHAEQGYEQVIVLTGHDRYRGQVLLFNSSERRAIERESQRLAEDPKGWRIYLHTHQDWLVAKPVKSLLETWLIVTEKTNSNPKGRKSNMPVQT